MYDPAKSKMTCYHYKRIDFLRPQAVSPSYAISFGNSSINQEDIAKAEQHTGLESSVILHAFLMERTNIVLPFLEESYLTPISRESICGICYLSFNTPEEFDMHRFKVSTTCGIVTMNQID